MKRKRHCPEEIIRKLRQADAELAAGQTIAANGQSLTAPAGGLTLIARGRLREVSIVASAATRRRAWPSPPTKNPAAG